MMRDILVVLGVFAFAIVSWCVVVAIVLYGAWFLDRIARTIGWGNCLFHALRLFITKREGHVVFEWSHNWAGPHVWYAARVVGEETEEYVPVFPIPRTLAPPVFRGKIVRFTRRQGQ